MSQGARSFFTTRWSVVLRAGQAGVGEGNEERDARDALERLAEGYWLPLFAYVRRRGYDEEAARDLTQAFFARLLERRDVASATPEKGRFRSFLITALKNFLVNQEERERALKRGGGRAPLSIDTEEAVGRLEGLPVDDETPERVFERAWARAVLDRTLARLAEQYAERGKTELFEALAEHLVGGSEGTPYAELAAELSLSVGAVKVAVHRLRARYREELRREIADTLADPGDVEDELRLLFEALGS